MLVLAEVGAGGAIDATTSKVVGHIEFSASSGTIGTTTSKVVEWYIASHCCLKHFQDRFFMNSQNPRFTKQTARQRRLRQQNRQEHVPFKAQVMQKAVTPAPAPVKLQVQLQPPEAPQAFPQLMGKFHGITVEDLLQQVLQLKQKQNINDSEYSKVANSLQEALKLLQERKGDDFIIRQARLSDIDSLYNMVNYWAQQGENLPRPREDIVRNIQTFAVCVKEDVVLGCACLYVYDSGLAEIRSLGVNPMVQRQGQGRSIVNFLLNRAQRFEIEKVFVLTRNPQFFSKVGFSETTINALPEKILKDCEHCAKRDKCDEVAYEINFQYVDKTAAEASATAAVTGSITTTTAH